MHSGQKWGLRVQAITGGLPILGSNDCTKLDSTENVKQWEPPTIQRLYEDDLIVAISKPGTLLVSYFISLSSSGYAEYLLIPRVSLEFTLHDCRLLFHFHLFVEYHDLSNEDILLRITLRCLSYWHAYRCTTIKLRLCWRSSEMLLLRILWRHNLLKVQFNTIEPGFSLSSPLCGISSVPVPGVLPSFILRTHFQLVLVQVEVILLLCNGKALIQWVGGGSSSRHRNV